MVDDDVQDGMYNTSKYKFVLCFLNVHVFKEKVQVEKKSINKGKENTEKSSDAPGRLERTTSKQNLKITNIIKQNNILHFDFVSASCLKAIQRIVPVPLQGTGPGR